MRLLPRFCYRAGAPLAVALSVSALLAPAASAQVQGISYTGAPIGMRVLFDNNAGLKDAYFYGGAVGVGFGQYLELSGEYLRADAVETDFDDFDGANGALLPESEFDLERYGANLRVNVGRSQLLPFLNAGTGVLRFDRKNDGDDKSAESIYLTYGGGITFSPADRITLELSANRFAYRYSPIATFALVGANPEDFPIRTVYNTALTAALRVYLGGRAPGGETDLDRALRSQLSGGGARIFVEPTYGLIQFNSRLGPSFPDEQPFAGVNAGIDLGPFVGARAFYWRATDEDEAFDDPTGGFRDLALFGGELNFRFANDLTAGITPYLIAGAGYLDAGREYDNEANTNGVPTDRYFATGGAGLDVPITPNFRLKAAARTLLLSDEDEEDIASTASVYRSWVYTAGLEFSLGGGRDRDAAQNIIDRRVERRVRSEREERDEEMGAEERRMRDEMGEEEARLRDEADRLREREADLQREERRLREERTGVRESPAREDEVREERRVVVVPREGETMTEARVRAERDAGMEVGRETARTETRRPANAALAGRTIEVPVPEVGEIYVRFGSTEGDVQVETVYAPPVVMTAPGMMAPQMAPQMSMTPAAPGQALSAEQIQNLVRETLRAELTRSGQAAAAEGRQLTREEIASIVRESVSDQQSRSNGDDLNAVALRLAAIEARLSAGPSTSPVTVIQQDPKTGEMTTVTTPSSVAGPGFFGYRFVGAVPYLGVRTGGDRTQALIGLRGDYRRLYGGGLRFMPEVAIGFADGVSLQAFGNFVTPVGTSGILNTGLLPYAGLGAGVTTASGLKGFGLALNLLVGGEYAFGPGNGFLEFSTLDFFDYNRLLLGYRFMF